MHFRAVAVPRLVLSCLESGRVGSGFDEATLISLSKKLEPIVVDEVPVQSPRPGAGEQVWVEPRYVCEVRYLERTDDRQLRHPVFDLRALAAQKRVRAINGTNNTWFCGAWMRNGFHEDGLSSAVDVAHAIQARTMAAIAAE